MIYVGRAISESDEPIDLQTEKYLVDDKEFSDFACLAKLVTSYYRLYDNFNPIYMNHKILVKDDYTLSYKEDNIVVLFTVRALNLLNSFHTYRNTTLRLIKNSFDNQTKENVKKILDTSTRSKYQFFYDLVKELRNITQHEDYLLLKDYTSVNINTEKVKFYINPQYLNTSKKLKKMLSKRKNLKNINLLTYLKNAYKVADIIHRLVLKEIVDLEICQKYCDYQPKFFDIRIDTPVFLENHEVFHYTNFSYIKHITEYIKSEKSYTILDHFSDEV